MTLRSRTLPFALALAVGLALAFAGPAEAAKAGKNKKRVAAPTKTTAHIQSHAATPCRGHNVVRCGPLYNGPEYLGTDPDPNIRFQLLRDLDARYGGGGD
jgi:hypothetical protein